MIGPPLESTFDRFRHPRIRKQWPARYSSSQHHGQTGETCSSSLFCSGFAQNSSPHSEHLHPWSSEEIRLKPRSMIAIRVAPSLCTVGRVSCWMRSPLP